MAIQSKLNFKLTNAFHLIITCHKGTSQKLGLGKSFVFVFSRDYRYSVKKSKDHWTNEISEEKEQIIQEKCQKKE